MSTTIIIKNSATSGSVPPSLVQGEFAVNVTDGRLFYGSGSGNIVKEFVMGGSGSGGSTDTGSLLTTASFSSPNLTFTKGNGSTFNVSIASLQVTSASYALTASHAPAYLPLTGGTINGNLTVNGTASITYLNTIYETASVIYSSGSNQFGDASNDTQTLYGTVDIKTGPLVITGSILATQSYISKVDYIDFNTNTSYTLAAGKLGWDNGEGGLQLGLEGGNVQYALGEQIVQYVYNAETSSLSKGQVVYISGSQGNKIAVKLASATNEAGSAATLGFVAETITAGGNGWIITEGNLRKLNTTGLTPGALLYLSSSLGQYTETKPQAPLHEVRLGYVERVHGTVGSIYVKIDNGYELDELHNILDTSTTASYGDLLVKSGSLWINSKQLTGSYGLTGSLSATSFTGSLLGTASYATQALSSSFATTSSYILNAVSSSFASTASYVLNAISSSFATSASFASSVPASGIIGNVSQIATGSVTASVSPSQFTVVSGSVTELVVTGTGVTIGSAITDTHRVSGSLLVTGSATITGSITQNASTASFGGLVGIGTTTPGARLDLRAQGALSTDTTFRIRNSANTFDLLNIDGVGLISGRTDGAGGFSMNYQGTAGTTTQLNFNNGNPTLRVAQNTGGHAFNVYASTDNREYLAGVIGKATFAIGANPLGGLIKPNEANTNTMYVFNGTAPTLNATDAFQLYSADRNGTAGKASPHFRTEDGTVVWLGDESRLFNITGSRTILSSSQNTISGSTLTVYGSGSAQPVFTVQGSQGELFSITDSLSGSLFSVNDISGLPILEVFSDNTTLIGNYLDPMLITTAKVTQTNSGSFTVYSLPTASYDTAFFEYSIKSGSNARAGTIMAIQSGTSVNFTETTTTDFGNTSAVSFTVIVTGSNMALTGSSTTGSWTIKSIIRGL